MSNLVAEILLRFVKPLGALLLAGLLFAILTAAGGAPASAELALLCWLSAAVLLLLFQESPL